MFKCLKKFECKEQEQRISSNSINVYVHRNNRSFLLNEKFKGQFNKENKGQLGLSNDEIMQAFKRT